MFGIKKMMLALLLTGSMTLGAGHAAADPGAVSGKEVATNQVTVKTTSKDGQDVVVHTNGTLTRVTVNGEVIDEFLSENGQPGTSIAGPFGQIVRWAIGIALDLMSDAGSSGGSGGGGDSGGGGSGSGSGSGNTGSGNGAGNSGSGTCNNNINNTGGGTVIVIAPCGPA